MYVVLPALALTLLISLCLTTTCRAQVLDKIQVRASLAAAAMISRDQLGRLGFDSIGGVGDVQVGYAVLPWLDVRAGVGAGAFAGAGRAGGLLAPLLGAALSWPNESIRPWLEADVGPGFTGALLRPLFRAAIGADFRLSTMLTLGPVVGYSHLFQTNHRGSSTDARFIWFGIALGLGPALKRQVTESVHWRTRERTHQQNTTTTVQSDPEPPPPSTVTAPSPELMALIETALPTQRSEWLAPILFAFDSAELQPQGVAMLHEVATELQHRPNLRLLEIQGYADSRGDAEHNLKLSERRAAAVFAWLVAHGVAPERLRIAAEGASQFVEPGRDESQHEQNRRVIFRVIDPAQP
jgi:outer membrane protein OmpA-like peptidoglycan-associated protein